MEKRTTNAVLFACLILVTALFSMDLYNPALPAIARSLSASQAMVRSLVIAYLLGFSLSQLVYGPLSDKRGRKPVILLGLVICIIGNIVSAVSTDAWMLFFSRLLTGLGAGAAPVIARAMIRDSFIEKHGLTSAFSLYAMSSTLSPAVAPAIGGFLQAHTGWQSTFIFLTGFTLLVCLLVFTCCRETQTNSQSTLICPISSYKEVLTNRVFMNYSLLSAFIYAVTIGYYTISPFIYQNALHLTAKQNGFCYMLYALGIFFGSGITNRISKRVEPEKTLWVGIGLMVIVNVIMVLINMAGYFNAYTMLIPTFFLAITCSMTGPILISLAILPFSKLAGAASALQGTIKMLGTGVVLAIFSFVHFHSQLPMSLFFLTISVAVLILNSANRRLIAAK